MEASGLTSRDHDRIVRVRQAIDRQGWNALLCTLPSNVLLVSGYWPVIGNAVAVVTREEAVAVLAPDDEEALAARSWADVVRTFQPGSLDALTSTLESIRGPLKELLESQGLERATIGFEGSGSFDPASYASMFVYGGSLGHLLRSVLPHASLADASSSLAQLRAVLTAREATFVRKACGIARSAFEHTAARLDVGMREYEVAAILRGQLEDPAGESRCDGFAWCMSGPNAAEAYAAFQRTRSRRIAPGDCLLVHCNSYCDGFWTDITRTFWMRPARDNLAMTEAVLTAAERARAAVRPGVAGSVVDRAARHVMTDRGLGAAFKHGTGHGVGFTAIDHNAMPRIHPRSDDRLEPGMIFNIEPAAYFERTAGLRHCDMVLVTETGAELLTPFQGTAGDLTRT